jgi:hypothetical protein
MFRIFVHTLTLWWQDFSEDILGADLPPSVYAEDLLEAHRADHHLRDRRLATAPRRPGTVAAPEIVCLTPTGHRRDRATTRSPLS